MKRLTVVAAMGLGALLLALPAGAGQSYTDSTGETAGSADITTVAVTNTAKPDTITFSVTTSMPTMEANAFIAILIDVDQNTNTGSQGFDDAIVVEGQQGELDTWTGSGFLPVGAVSWTYANGVLNASILASDLLALSSATNAEPKVFNFGIITGRGPDPNNPIEDHAPDTGLWTYTLNPPPTPPTPQAPLPPAKSKPAQAQVVYLTAATSGKPTAGKTFTVHALDVHLSDGTTRTATALACKASLAGKKFSGTGKGHCTFHLPATAKGKRFVVRISGTFRTAPLSSTTGFTVR